MEGEKSELYTIFEEIETNAPMKLGLDGVYIGTSMYGDKVKNKINKLEKDIDKKNAFYFYEVLNGENIDKIMLTSISTESVPIFSLPNKTDHFNYFSKIEELLKSIGNYSYLVVIEMPLYNEDIEPSSYKKDYEKIYNLIKENIRNSIIIFPFGDEDYYSAIEYYPNDKYVDVVSLNITAYNHEHMNYVYNYLDTVYYNFQNKKPIIVKFNASYYNTGDYTYDIPGASKSIKEFYESVEKNYPAVKAVVYMNNLFIPDTEVIVHDVSLENEEILNSYKTAIKSSYFKNNFKSTINNKTIFKYEKKIDINDDKQMMALIKYAEEKNYEIVYKNNNILIKQATIR